MPCLTSMPQAEMEGAEKAFAQTNPDSVAPQQKLVDAH